jgi:hypothetical protein
MLEDIKVVTAKEKKKRKGKCLGPAAVPNNMDILPSY